MRKPLLRRISNQFALITSKADSWSRPNFNQFFGKGSQSRQNLKKSPPCWGRDEAVTSTL